MNAEEIERIVAKVLEQLQPAAARRASVSAAPAAKAVVSSTPKELDVVAIPEAVITGPLLLERVGSKRTVRIPRHAVLTPSARDVLRTKSIECLRESAKETSGTAPRWLALVSHSSSLVTSALEQVKENSGWERRISGTTIESAQQAISAICRGEAEGVVAVTSEPELFACLTNRHAQVRAAVVHEARSLSALRQTFQPNVLAVNPAGKSLMELRNLFRSLS